MVCWEVNESKVSGIDIDEINIQDVFKADWNKESYKVAVPTKSGIFDFDLSSLLAPVLGNYWRVMYSEGKYDSIKESMANYWCFRNKPSIVAHTVNFSDGRGLLIGTKIIKEEKKSSTAKIGSIIRGVNDSFNYDRTVIGYDGRGNIELQFLNSSNRVDASKGDFIDPGIFVSLNGSVKVAAGVNRLICVNGLTETMQLWSSDNFDFHGDFIERGVRLAEWFVSKQDEKVLSLKELSAIMHCYPKPLIAKYWQNWSKNVENEELTWYEVINDITSYARAYLGTTRHKLLDTPQVMHEFGKCGCCPVCQTKI